MIPITRKDITISQEDEEEGNQEADNTIRATNIAILSTTQRGIRVGTIMQKVMKAWSTREPRRNTRRLLREAMVK